MCEFFSWVVEDRRVETCFMCALSHMFKIQATLRKFSLLHKQTELQAKTKIVGLQLKGMVCPQGEFCH